MRQLMRQLLRQLIYLMRPIRTSIARNPPILSHIAVLQDPTRLPQMPSFVSPQVQIQAAAI